MTLPTFLGIGVPRAGTTWLHNLLSSHPDVYMPTRRKEVRFFDKYYDEGAAWYESFFPTDEEAVGYQAIGEISTQYYNCGACPERIYTTLPNSKLIIMLRHPISRAYSHYGFVVQRRNYRGTFEEFLVERSSALEKGFYSQYLKQYLRYFERDRILALIFEDVFVDIHKTKNTVADFLDIAKDKFPVAGAKRKVNASSVPTYQSIYSFFVRTGRQFRRWNLEPVVDFVMRLGIQRHLARGKALPSLDEELKVRLSQLYQDEFDELERCMEIDLSSWRA